ncbi:hypothetical protein TcBrA4_0037880 [Trypanosoma cruzi]|nr:hypothetical protein TcBrA4_0037880 [Trypanosoma cruzi]
MVEKTRRVRAIIPPREEHSLLRRGRINPAATHCEVTLAIRPALAACLLLGCVQVDRSLWAEGTLVAGGPPRAVRLRNKPSRVPGTAKEAPQDDEGEPGAQHEADQTTKMTVVTSCAETAVEGELPAGSQEAPRKGMRSPGIEPGPPALMMREFSHWTNCALNTILLPILIHEEPLEEADCP